MWVWGKGGDGAGVWWGKWCGWGVNVFVCGGSFLFTHCPLLTRKCWLESGWGWVAS